MKILGIPVALLVYSNQATIKAHQVHSEELSLSIALVFPIANTITTFYQLIHLTMSLQPPFNYSATLVPILRTVSSAQAPLMPDF